MPPAEEPLRIKSVSINNFKSLHHFKLDLSKLTCLIGLNGAGKTTVLQAFDFISRLMRGNITGWFEERQWKPTAVRNADSLNAEVSIQVELTQQDGTPFGHWTGRVPPSTGKCDAEIACAFDDQLRSAFDCWKVFKAPDQVKPSVDLTSYHAASRLFYDLKTELRLDYFARRVAKTSFRFEGSILSQLEDSAIGENLVRLKNSLAAIKSLELLSPENLRQRTREAKGDLGTGGQRLAAFLHELGKEKRDAIVNQLNKVYPNLERIDVKALRSGWKQLEIVEQFDEVEIRSEARHASDGMLRLIAIAASLYREQSCLLFDEIENGINPELAEFVVDLLLNAPAQVIVTTHSPLFLNWLPDEVARKSVMYLYRTEAGETRVVPFFEIPSMRKKLEVMGPGEAYVDTNLHALEEELRQLPEAKAG